MRDALSAMVPAATAHDRPLGRSAGPCPARPERHVEPPRALLGRPGPLPVVIRLQTAQDRAGVRDEEPPPLSPLARHAQHHGRFYVALLVGVVSLRARAPVRRAGAGRDRGRHLLRDLPALEPVAGLYAHQCRSCAQGRYRRRRRLHRHAHDAGGDRLYQFRDLRRAEPQAARHGPGDLPDAGRRTARLAHAAIDDGVPLREHLLPPRRTPRAMSRRSTFRNARSRGRPNSSISRR